MNIQQTFALTEITVSLRKYKKKSMVNFGLNNSIIQPRNYQLQLAS